MAAGEEPIFLNDAMRDLETYIAGLRCRVAAGQRHVEDQLTLKIAELERLSGELLETTNREVSLQGKLEKIRARESLWKWLARIKMRKLDNMENLYKATSLQLEKKIETNQQLMKVLQETAKFADELRATSKAYQEKLERVEEELSRQRCVSGREMDSLKSQIADLTSQIKNKQDNVDIIEGERQQCEREKAKLSGQLSVAQLKVTSHGKEHESLQSKIAVLEAQNRVIEDDLRAVTEECLTWRVRAERCENAAQQVGALRNQHMAEDQLEGQPQEPRGQNGAGPGDNM